MQIHSKVLSDSSSIDFWNCIDKTFMKIIHTDDVAPSSIVYPPNLVDLNFKYETQLTTGEEIIFPESVKVLELETTYPLELFVFPRNLKKLVIHVTKDQTLKNIILPQHTITLELVGKFSEDLSLLELPQSLENLKLGHRFNHPIPDLNYLKHLKRLVFGQRFNHDLNNLPKSLEYLQVGEQYNKTIEPTQAIVKKGEYFEQYDKLLKQKEFVSSLPVTIKKALKWYTGPGEEINKIVRKRGKMDKIIQTAFNKISGAFKNAPKLEESLVVYRGLKEEPDFSQKSFISTSVSLEVATSYTLSSCCLLEITLLPGVKVLPLVGVSLYPEQEEVLLNISGILTKTGEETKNGMKVFKCTYSPRISLKRSVDKTLTKLGIEHNEEDSSELSKLIKSVR